MGNTEGDTLTTFNTLGIFVEVSSAVFTHRREFCRACFVTALIFFFYLIYLEGHFARAAHDGFLFLDTNSLSSSKSVLQKSFLVYQVDSIA